MGTVWTQNGVSVRIYTHDHPPPHVHCKVGNGEVVINLDPISIRSEKGVKAKEVKKALKVVKDKQDFLISEWQRINPKP